jgi:hypothetical protein
MTPEEEIVRCSCCGNRHRPKVLNVDDALALTALRLAALEREKEVLENAWAGLSAENARLREALHVIRITGPEREAGLAREALTGAPAAPDAQEADRGE